MVMDIQVVGSISLLEAYYCEYSVICLHVHICEFLYGMYLRGELLHPKVSAILLLQYTAVFGSLIPHLFLSYCRSHRREEMIYTSSFFSLR